MTVSFQTNKLKSRRKALIDGHEYTVRQFGNIEQLEMMRLQDELTAIVAKYPADAKDADYSPEDTKAIFENTRQSSEMIMALFDDGTDTQEHSRKLVKSLTEDDIFDMLSQIFAQTEKK
jgi:hypothetical protein